MLVSVDAVCVGGDGSRGGGVHVQPSKKSRMGSCCAALTAKRVCVAQYSDEIPAVHLVEPAKSNRALCKQCKVKIDKACSASAPSRRALSDTTSLRGAISVPEDAKRLALANLTGFDALTPEDQATVTAWHTMGGAKAPGKALPHPRRRTVEAVALPAAAAARTSRASR